LAEAAAGERRRHKDAVALKVVISGYYGFGNAGDEAILEAILSDLRSVRPKIRAVVLSGDPPATAARFGVEAVPRWNLPAVVRALRGAALFISGGGSLLQDVTGWGSVPYYAGLIYLARLMGVPVFVYAQGLGPLRRRPLQALARWALNAAAEVTLRDRLSYQLARRLGVDDRKLAVTADPVFGLAARAVSAGPESAPVVGVALRPDPGGDAAMDEAVSEAVAAALAPRLAGWNARVVLLPLHPGRDGSVLRLVGAKLEDLGLGQRIVAWAPSRGAGCAAMSARDWMLLFSRLDVCVTMRLHALIFAACAGVPFVALSGDPKVAAHVDELGLPRGLCLAQPPSSPEQLGAMLDGVWEKRAVFRSLLRERSEALAARARETALRALRWARG